MIKLKCPSKTLQGNGLSIYEDFINNVNDFKEIDLLPVTVKIDDDTNAHNLFDNNAKWHKSCHLNFATSKLLKIKKRKYAEAESKIRKSTRLSYGIPSKASCLFCSGTSGTLHDCSTMSFEFNLKNMATDLGDTTILAKLSGGDVIAIEGKYHFDCLNI